MNQTNFWNDAAKYGAVIGGASAVCSLLGDATGAGFFGLIGLALYIGLLLYYTRKRATSRSTREEEYGYGRRLGFIIAMALFVGVINAAYTILASRILFTDKYAELYEQSFALLSKTGLYTGEMISQMALMVQSPLWITFSSVTGQALLGLLFGLVLAALAQPRQRLDISVVVPLYNEEESLPELTAWIDRVARENGLSYEIVFVDDGSTDGSWETLERLKEHYPALRAIGFARNYGKSAALYCGFAAAEGDVVFTMDADLQDSPDEIPDMRRMILEEGYDMVSGWKLKRHDPIGKRWPSKFFNWTARTVSGIKLHDFNCGLKAYRRKVVKSIEVYGEMHRYIPILAKEAGFRRIGEKVVCHRARKYGSSKFGMERMVKGYLDLITVSFLSHFGRSPMYFFGGLGTLMFLLGGCSTIWIIATKLYKQAHGLPLRAVTEQPLFYLSMLLVILGVQFFLAGFLGELIDRNASDRNKYLIDKNI